MDPGALSPDQISQSIYTAITGSGESIIEGTVVALLPILWFMAIAVHLARPYILNVVTKFSLRLGADLWWLVYIIARDLIIVVIFVLSMQFFFVDPFIAGAWPITGGLAAVCALAVLVIKLIWDADDEPRAFYAVSVLLGLGAMLYLVPTFVGVQASAFSNFHSVSSVFISSDHPVFSAGMTYVSMGLAGALGLVAVIYVAFFHAVPTKDLPPVEAPSGGE